MTKKQYEFTQEGLDVLKIELDELKNVKRVQNIEDIKDARAQGDLSENADYDAARNEQARIEKRIKEIEDIIKNAKIFRASSDDNVNIGKRVELYFVEQKKTQTLDIVGSLESNPVLGKISVDSPLGKSIRNHQVGDKVSVKTSTGNIFTVEIKKISAIE